MSENKQNKGAAGRQIVQCLVGQNIELQGDIIISGGLHIDGKVTGDITVRDGDAARLTLSATGVIDGNVSVNDADINGIIKGDVYARGTVTLYPDSRVDGDVHYESLEIKRGALVNGRLIALSNARVKNQPGLLGKLRRGNRESTAKSA